MLLEQKLLRGSKRKKRAGDPTVRNKLPGLYKKPLQNKTQSVGRSSSESSTSEEDNDMDLIDLDNFSELEKNLEEGDYVLIEFKMQPNNKKVFYVGKVVQYETKEFEISFPGTFCHHNH